MSDIQESRRMFLRGMGAAMALPAFASLRPGVLGSPASSLLAASREGAPLRSAFVYFPNGAIPGSWWPSTPGSDYELSPTLQPLSALREHFQVLSGLDQVSAEAGPDGAGDHARGGGVFLTGVRLRKSASDVRAGISIDQAMAEKIGQQTRFSSLELTCDAVRPSGACDSGYACAYQFNMSWSGPSTPKAPEVNPRLAFERLFGEGAPDERTSNLRRRQSEQRSLLDFVMEDAMDMKRRLNGRDGNKLDQYLTGVREIEQRISKMEQLGLARSPNAETPNGIPDSYAEHVQLMYDMMVLAFQSDSTRVATFLLAHDGSNRSFDDIEVFEGHHDLSHHQDRADWIAKIQRIDQWYVKQLAAFLDKLSKVEDIDGRSLLHNSMIVYGSGNADGNRHTHTNLPIILAGHGGGTLRPGSYRKFESRPLCDLFVSMANRMGDSSMSQFGDSREALQDI
jgi:hypothetical protein